MDENGEGSPEAGRVSLSRRGVAMRAGIFVVFVAVAVVVGLLVDLPEVDEVRAAVDDAGVIGVLVFALAYGAITLTPAPKAVLSIAAGALFGFWQAIPIVIFGAMLGATTAFVLGRALGRDAVEQYVGARIDRVDALLSERGLPAVIAVRLVPIIPFTVINYASGLTGLRQRDYLLGTAIGMLPGIAAYVAIGAYGVELDGRVWIALGALGVLSLAGIVGAWWMKKRGTL
ncbi:MAG TPA: TVP38/TMEM64 family protein [Microcella sp.]|nr:TVP38/TMEM64 family protein [Microcella sp.]